MPRAILREGRVIVWHLCGVLGSRAIIAICLLVSATVIIGAWRNVWFDARCVLVDGVVIQHSEELAADWAQQARGRPDGPSLAAARRVRRAVFEFTVDGRPYQVVADEVPGARIYPLGSRQSFAYMRGRPQDARLQADLPGFWSQAALLLMGTIVASGALRWWWWVARQQRRLRHRLAHRVEPLAPGAGDDRAAPPSARIT